MLQTPILFLIFNRPDVTATTFERIREAKPTRLYVAADGPRTAKAGETELCEQTRAVIQKIDWTCEVKTLFRQTNLGCGKAVSEAITWFFEAEEQGIILEDDCLPHLSFFNYCENILNYYQNDERVMHVGGSSFLYGKVPLNDSYYFSSMAHVWGWATWRRAWKKYNFKISDFYSFVREGKIYDYYPDEGMSQHWLETFKRMYYQQIDTWDYQWVYAIYKNSGMAVIPRVNLISNIGFRADATHTSSADSIYADNKSEAIEAVLSHPKKIEVNRAIDYFYFKNIEKFTFLNPVQNSGFKNLMGRANRVLKRFT